MTRSTQTFPAEQDTPSQSSTSVSQRLPSKPLAHAQVNWCEGTTVRQVPLLRHGVGSQASYTRSQCLPMKSVGQLQEKSLTRSVQVPLLKHGLESHSLMLVSQRGPGESSFVIGKVF